MDYATTLNIDQQGRIIIPAKVRKALQLHTGDVLMLEADTRNICLRKCDSHIPMDIRLDSFLDILHSNVPCRILLCNHSKIIASKNYHTALNMPVTESIQITQKVYENGQWSKQDLDLNGKLLLYVKSSSPMPATTEQINNEF